MNRQLSDGLILLGLAGTLFNIFLATTQHDWKYLLFGFSTIFFSVLGAISCIVFALSFALKKEIKFLE